MHGCLWRPECRFWRPVPWRCLGPAPHAPPHTMSLMPARCSSLHLLAVAAAPSPPSSFAGGHARERCRAESSPASWRNANHGQTTSVVILRPAFRRIQCNQPDPGLAARLVLLYCGIVTEADTARTSNHYDSPSWTLVDRDTHAPCAYLPTQGLGFGLVYWMPSC